MTGMAVLNKKYRYLYLAEPETGSRSCAAALKQHKGSEIIPGHHIDPWQMLKRGLIDIKTLKNVITFSFIRNPLDILVSRTLKGSKHSLRFHINRCHGRLFYKHHGCDQLLRYEYGLEKELNLFLGSIGAPRITLDMIGKSADKKPWRTYYTEADLEFARLLIPEIEAYGY